MGSLFLYFATPHPSGIQTLINYKSCAISVQVAAQGAPFLWKGEMPAGTPVDPTRSQLTTHTRQQHPVSSLGAEEQRTVCTLQGYMCSKRCSKEQLQALLIKSPFIVLTQILTFALELETRIIKPQISKHNGLVLYCSWRRGWKTHLFPLN